MFSFKSLVTLLVSAALTAGITLASPEARLQVGKVIAKAEQLADHTLERLDRLVINADASTSTQVQAAGGATQTKVESQVKSSSATSATTNGATTSSNNATVAPNTSVSVEAQAQGTATQGGTSTSFNAQSQVEGQANSSLSIKKIIKKLSDPLGLNASLDLSSDVEANTTSGR